jgi:hypothetical protein
VNVQWVRVPGGVQPFAGAQGGVGEWWDAPGGLRLRGESVAGTAPTYFSPELAQERNAGVWRKTAVWEDAKQVL